MDWGILLSWICWVNSSIQNSYVAVYIECIEYIEYSIFFGRNFFFFNLFIYFFWKKKCFFLKWFFEISGFFWPPILDTRISVRSFVCSSIMLVLPPLKSETGCIGELWSICGLLLLKVLKRIAFFFAILFSNFFFKSDFL